MRIGRVTVVAALAVLLGSASANATVYIDDDFNAYTPGDLAGQGGWAIHSGAVDDNPVQVVSGSPCYVDDPGNSIEFISASYSHDVNTPMGYTMGTGDKVYAAFCVVIDEVAGDDITNDNYFAHFKTSGTYYGGKVFAAPPNVAGGDFTFAYQSVGSGEVASVFWGTDFAYGSCNTIVISYDYDTAVGEMWVNPICALGPDGNPKLVDDTGTYQNAFEAFAFRQDSYSGPDPTFGIDNLMVGTSFAEVCQECVPEPASLTLLAIGAIAALRRRR